MGRMTKEEVEEYRMYVETKYDEYLMETEGRGMSWGEVAHINSLKVKDLRGLEREIDEEMEKIEKKKGGNNANGEH